MFVPKQQLQYAACMFALYIILINAHAHSVFIITGPLSVPLTAGGPTINI